MRGRMLLDEDWEVKVDGPFWIQQRERGVAEHSLFTAPETSIIGPSLTGDVYSYGMLLWELVKGVRWEGKEKKPELKGLSGSMRKLLGEMWADDPQVRPAMESVIKAMEAQKWAVVDGADPTKVGEYVMRVRSAESKCPVQPL
jgi:hypothetical protein